MKRMCNSLFATHFLQNNDFYTQMKRYISTLVITLISVLCSSAQVVINTKAGDISMRLTGRTSLDIGMLAKTDEGTVNGVMLNDTRLGTMLNFDDKWNAHFELLLDNKTVSFRDITIAYSFDEHHSVKAGNYFMPFGAKITGLAYKFCEDAPVDFAISPNRKMGAAYFYTSDKLNITAGLFSDGNADAKALDQGWNLAGKVVYRPIINDNKVLHFGFAPLYTQSSNGVEFKGIIPSTIGMPMSVGGYMSAKNVFRLEGEALYINGRFYAEARYQRADVSLHNESYTADEENVENEQISVSLHSSYYEYVGENSYEGKKTNSDKITAEGFYAQMSFLLMGDQQQYHKAMAFSIAPAPKSLELLLRVSHLNIEEIGRTTDITVGLTYHFNKYLNAKINAVTASSSVEDMIFALQGRLQFSF